MAALNCNAESQQEECSATDRTGCEVELSAAAAGTNDFLSDDALSVSYVDVQRTASSNNYGLKQSRRTFRKLHSAVEENHANVQHGSTASTNTNGLQIMAI